MKKTKTKSNHYKSNKYAQVTEELFKIEDKFNLFESVIDNTYFWEMIRFDVQSEIFSSLGLRSGTQSSSHFNLCMKYGKKIIKNLFVKNPFLVSDHEVLFFTSGRRKKMGDDNYWDIYVDPILESLDLDYIYFEKHGDKHSKPPKTSNIKYLDLIYLDQVGIKLGAPSVGLSKKEKKYIKKIEREIKDRFSVEIDLIEKIKNTIRSRKILLPLYNKILDKVDPNLVIVVTSYGYGKKTFIEVCKSLEIPVIELQHGMIHRYHLGYNFPDQKSIKYFPDHLFTFGDYWKEEIEYPISDENIYLVGYPYLEMQKEKYKGIERRDQIVFISQPTIGDKFSKIARNIAEMNLDYDVIVKIHPKRYDDWQNHYPCLKNKNISVIKDEKPLYQLFAESKIQVGVYSTAIYEGLNYNVKTFLINLPGIESMTPLIKASNVKVVSNAKELNDMIKQEDTTDRVDPDYFFKPNAIENIRRALDQIMSDID